MESDNTMPEDRSVWDVRAEACSKRSSHDWLVAQPLTRQLADRSVGCAQPSQWTLIPERLEDGRCFPVIVQGTGLRIFLTIYVCFYLSGTEQPSSRACSAQAAAVYPENSASGLSPQTGKTRVRERKRVLSVAG